jgi:hypothetical protein
MTDTLSNANTAVEAETISTVGLGADGRGSEVTDTSRRAEHDRALDVDAFGRRVGSLDGLITAAG